MAKKTATLKPGNPGYNHALSMIRGKKEALKDALTTDTKYAALVELAVSQWLSDDPDLPPEVLDVFNRLFPDPELQSPGKAAEFKALDIHYDEEQRKMLAEIMPNTGIKARHNAEPLGSIEPKTPEVHVRLDDLADKITELTNILVVLDNTLAAVMRPAHKQPDEPVKGASDLPCASLVAHRLTAMSNITQNHIYRVSEILARLEV